MSTGIVQHHWGAWDAMLRYVERIASRAGFVVEIGPGPLPFGPAHEYVDWGYVEAWKQAIPAGKKLHEMDITAERLPYDDKSVDFLYCRHTLEDIVNPFWVCREISRVAKAGYLETPSPLAEICRGIDIGKPPWRGYHHHRNIVWNDNGVLTFLPKYPIIEHYSFGDLEGEVLRLLNEGPLHWNTYYFWTDAIQMQLLWHERDFFVTANYGEIIAQGIQKTLAHHERIKASQDYRSC
jgi:Methyltransferase domain